MRSSRKRITRNEQGKILVLVLVLMVVGGLLLAALLGFMGTGLMSGMVYERKAAELYAADAGVEDGIWKIQNPDASGLGHGECADAAWTHLYPEEEAPPFQVNGKDVEVSIEYHGNGVFVITSKATTPETGSSTTILAHVWGDYAYGYADEDHTVQEGGEYPEANIEGDVTVHALGDLHVTGNIEDGAVVYVEGDLVVEGTIEGGEIGAAEVYVRGNLTLTGEAKLGNGEDPVIICVGGNLTAPGNIETLARVFVGENLMLGGKIETGAEVCVQGNATVTGIEWDDEEGPATIVCVGDHLTVNGDVEGGWIYVVDPPTATGTYDPTVSGDFADCPVCYPDCAECDCCQCIWPAGTLTWTGFDVATYNING